MGFNIETFEEKYREMAQQLEHNNSLNDKGLNIKDVLLIENVQERNKKIITYYKEKGIFDERVTLRVKSCKARDGQQYNKARFLIVCYVIASQENFQSLENPLIGDDWTIAFSSSTSYDEGDILRAGYDSSDQDNPERGHKPIIRIKQEKVRKIDSISKLKLDYGVGLVNFFEKEFNDKGGSIASLGFEFIQDQYQEELLNLKLKNKRLADSISMTTEVMKELEVKKKELEQVISYYVESKKELKESYQLLRESLGFQTIDELENNQDDISEIINSNANDLYEIIQLGLYHYKGEKLIYNLSMIRRFVSALRTNQLILLSGPSGTGKSSLINQFSSMCKDVVVHHVPVQSNWLDSQDLLGIFNPLDRRYLSTPFLDALIAAKQDEINEMHKLHIILLDEMNLSHIEYYFAPFLSVREKVAKEQVIDLYSTRYECEARSCLKEYFKKEWIEISHQDIKQIPFSEREKIQWALDLCFNYPSKFKLPQNIRFVGTLNVDGSVKEISPKVIDRSFILELNYQYDEILEENLQKGNYGENSQLDLNLKEFLQIPTIDLNERQKVLLEKVRYISDTLKVIPNASLNSRGIKHCEQYIAALSLEEDLNEIFDDLLMSKLLPRIRFNKSDEKFNKSFETFKQIIREEDASNSINKINQMCSVHPNLVKFWG